MTVASRGAVMHEAVIEALRRRGEPIAVAELARELVAATHIPRPELARRLVATALEWDPVELPDPLESDHLRPPAAREVARVALERADFAVVDLETTGLGPGRAEILEIGAVRIRGLELADEFECFVKPEVAIPARITRLTGIDAPMVSDAPELAEAIAAFCSWFARTPRACFVAHNAGFDSGFVSVALERCARPPLAAPVLCTRRLGRRLAPEVGRYGLDPLSAHFGVSNAARHRALGDARATAQVLVELLARARARDVQTVGALLDLQQAPVGRRRRGRRGRLQPSV